MSECPRHEIVIVDGAAVRADIRRKQSRVTLSAPP